MRFLLHFPNSRFCDSIYFFPTFSTKLFSSALWRRFLSLKTNLNFQFRRKKLRFRDSGGDHKFGDLHYSGSDLESQERIDCDLVEYGGHVDSGVVLDESGDFLEFQNLLRRRRRCKQCRCRLKSDYNRKSEKSIKSILFKGF